MNVSQINQNMIIWSTKQFDAPSKSEYINIKQSFEF